MRLVRIKDEGFRYYILINSELFPLEMALPSDLRVHMPISSNEFLPAICEVLQRGDMLAKQEARFLKATPDQFKSFRRPLQQEDLTLPVQPASFRDFYAFEEHVRNARAKRNLPVPPEWYKFPAFYFSNTSCFQHAFQPLSKPAETEELDYELEVAVVIGKYGKDIPVEEADSYIAGFTILNDWSARDIQREEMKIGLGPAKGKDFATTLGSYLVTPDALQGSILSDDEKGKRYQLNMLAYVNGSQISAGNLKDMNWTFAELIHHASRNALLQPGDVIGSGTVGTGCLTEFPADTFAWLKPGDTVTLEVEHLGSLTTSVIV